MTSVTVPSASRARSSRMRRSSGPTPSMGEIAPPRTWYRPRNSRVFSIAKTSLGSSTTHRIDGSRRASRQIRQVSSSETFPQTTQNRTFSLTSRRTAARRFTSAGSAARMWKAMRWALFGPTPGRRPSSSIRSWTIPSYMRDRSAHQCSISPIWVAPSSRMARSTPEASSRSASSRLGASGSADVTAAGAGAAASPDSSRAGAGVGSAPA